MLSQPKLNSKAIPTTFGERPICSPLVNTITDLSDYTNRLATIINEFKCRLLPHVPKLLRTQVCDAYCKILNSICSDPQNLDNWMRLHIFAFCTLKAPVRGGKKNQSLRTIIENRIQKFLNETPIINGPSRQNTNLSGRKGGKLKDHMLQKLVCAKVEEGRIKDAVRLLVDNNEMASNNSDTLALLQEKHPRRSDHELINMQTNEVINVHLEEVKCSLESFPRGSAGGIDGLTPQLLKDMFVNVDEGPEKTQRLKF